MKLGTCPQCLLGSEPGSNPTRSDHWQPFLIERGIPIAFSELLYKIVVRVAQPEDSAQNETKDRASARRDPWGRSYNTQARRESEKWTQRNTTQKISQHEENEDVDCVSHNSK